MPKKIDLTNKIFENWTVIREASKEEKNGRPGTYWLCKCSCGTEKIVNGQTLRNGQSSSCGCQSAQKIAAATRSRAEDLTGKIFGRFTVLERDYNEEKNGSTRWKCKCDCGNIIVTNRNSLLNGHTKSCGCLRKETVKNIPHYFIDETGNKYGKLTVIEPIQDNGIKWKCQCECGNIKIVSGTYLRNGTTSSCGCLGKSKGEYLIEKLLNDNNILFIKEYPIIIENHRLRFDFAILENNIVKYFIEFDGKQHFESIKYFGGENYFNYIKNNDNLKNKWCKDNNIPLIRIPYTLINELSINNLKI